MILFVIWFLMDLIFNFILFFFSKFIMLMVFNFDMLIFFEVSFFIEGIVLIFIWVDLINLKIFCNFFFDKEGIVIVIIWMLYFLINFGIFFNDFSIFFFERYVFFLFGLLFMNLMIWIFWVVLDLRKLLYKICLFLLVLMIKVFLVEFVDRYFIFFVLI